MTANSAGAYESSWYAETLTVDPECRQLASNLDVDVCVVGGEVAGLTIAHALARHGWSVVVLAPDRIGAGTEAGTGIVAPGFCEPPEGIVARVGAERAKALWQLSAAGVERVRETMAAAGLTEAASPQPGLLVAERADREAAVQRNVDLINSTFGVDAEYWPSAGVRNVLRSGLMHQAVHFPRAFHLQPLHYVHGLAGAARSLGVRIYENTPVERVDAFGIRKQVDAAGWRVRARHIVLAAPGDLGVLHPDLAGTVLTLTYPVGVTAPLGERLEEAVRFAGAAVAGPAASSHRIVGGDRLMWAGRLTTGRKPMRRLTNQIGRAIVRTYPQLAGLTVEHAWYARADYAVHRMPQIGELASGLWLAAAFGHNGMATATMAGGLIADAIFDGDDRWRLFRSYGLVWTGGVMGRVMVGAALSLSHARAMLRERKTSARLPPVDVAASSAAASVAAPAAREASASAAAAVEAPAVEPPVAAAAATQTVVVEPLETAPPSEVTTESAPETAEPPKDEQQPDPARPTETPPRTASTDTVPSSDEPVATAVEPAGASVPEPKVDATPPEQRVAARAEPVTSPAIEPRIEEPPPEEPVATGVEPVVAPIAEPLEVAATDEAPKEALVAETPSVEPTPVTTTAEAPPEKPMDTSEASTQPAAPKPAKKSRSRNSKSGASRQKKSQGERAGRPKRQSKSAKAKAVSPPPSEGEGVPQQPAPGDAEQKETSRIETAPGDAPPSETNPSNADSSDTKPDDTKPNDTEPGDTPRTPT